MGGLLLVDVHDVYSIDSVARKRPNELRCLCTMNPGDILTFYVLSVAAMTELPM
jgi:hypothetical protein